VGVRKCAQPKFGHGQTGDEDKEQPHEQENGIEEARDTGNIGDNRLTTESAKRTVDISRLNEGELLSLI